ncbi:MULTISPECIES: thiamine pyrophosphate-dependent enzyme [Streptomyces]|uniref:thiamine pyrophosphate-dependent enzyme n=1 Tax=Streptomyces TaxID=1883 RepID=UPI0022498210|nr:thiamine pyrophosphate-dependent enzyme [Streptomyces sp. JHD 1]MCX2967281.1 thiamine pyrophosphate-binding protein [Streptomyces sp. JHD 1]
MGQGARSLGVAGARAVVDVLRSEGAKWVFGNPGTTELALLESLAEQGDVGYALALQEASAVAMADGYARVTGAPAFVNLHAAGGLGNGIGALTNAAAAQVPLVVTAGQQDQRHLVHEPVLAGDLAGLAAPTVKEAFEVGTREELGEALRRAFRLARTPPTGPVFLALPMNLLDEHGPGAPEATPVAADAAAPVAELRELLERTPAARTALVYGDEVARGAAREGVRLAERLGVPVWGGSWPAANPFPTGHPLWAGYLPPRADAMRETLAAYRLVVVFGGSRSLARLYPYEPGPLLPSGSRLVQVSQDPAAPGTATAAHLGLWGGLRATMRSLLDALPPAGRDGPGAAAGDEGAAGDAAFDHAAVSAVLAERVHAGTRVFDEAPRTSPHLRGALRLAEANQYQWTAGGLGWAMPAAVGATLAEPRRETLCVVGDGSALYSPQALWSAAHLRLPVTFVVVNDRQYGILKDNWRVRPQAGDTELGMNLSSPGLDFAALAAAHGVPARRAVDADSLRAALDARPQEGPLLVEARLARG